MTIENTLERIATALEKIASGQASLNFSVASDCRATGETAPPPPVAAPAAPTAPRPRGRPPKQQAEALPAGPGRTESAEPIEDEPPADNFLDVAEATVVAYTIEQVREAIVGYQKKTGDPEKARKLLKTVGGVDTLRSLPEDKFGAIIEACKK